MGFEPTISAGERPKTYALDRHWDWQPYSIVRGIKYRLQQYYCVSMSSNENQSKGENVFTIKLLFPSTRTDEDSSIVLIGHVYCKQFGTFRWFVMHSYSSSCKSSCPWSWRWKHYGPSKRLQFYKLTWCNNIENRNIQQHRCEDLKYHKEICCFHNQQPFYCSAEFQKSVLHFVGRSASGVSNSKRTWANEQFWNRVQKRAAKFCTLYEQFELGNPGVA